MKFEPFVITIETPAEAVVLAGKLQAPLSPLTTREIPESILEDHSVYLDDADVDLCGKVADRFDISSMSPIDIDNILAGEDDDDDMVSVPRRLLDELLDYA